MTVERRIRVGVLFGGESAEHEVSLQSARNVIDAIDLERYEPVLIGIDRSGRWHVANDARALVEAADDPRRIRMKEGSTALALSPGRSAELVPRDRGPALPPLDVVFPVLHGPLGEDGTVQGLLRLAHLPFVGPGVLGSAIGMDKDVTKRLLRDAGIPVAPFLTACRSAPRPTWEEAVEALGTPVFIKPANMGSSVGVSRAADAEAYERGLEEAFSFDTKVLLETTIRGREIECAVLGNEAPEASIPGEIAPRHEFYSYEAKYLDEAGADLLVPAPLDAATTRRVQELSIRVFRTLCCEGMARVDCFLTEGEDGGVPEIIVNEINTIPGFTKISMYPKLWAASGVSYPALIDRLLTLAIERSKRDEALRSAIDLGADAPAGTGAVEG